MARGGRGRLRTVLMAVAAAVAILACGAKPPPENIPVATLAPSDAGFRVAIVKDTVLEARAGSNGALLWLDQLDQLGQPSNPSLVYAGGTLYRLSRTAPLVIAIRPSDGTLLWKLATCSSYDDTLYRDAGLFFVTCGAQGPTSPDSVSHEHAEAVDPLTGHVVWNVDGAHVRAVGSGLAVLQTATGLRGVDERSGATRWTHDVQITPEATPLDTSQGQFSVRVWLSGQTIYYSPDGQIVEALRATDGTRLWLSPVVQDPFTEVGQAPLRDATVVAFTTTTVLTRSRYGVTALNAADGTVRWRYYNYVESDVPATVGPDGTIYVLSFVHKTDAHISLSAFAPDDGAARWQRSGPTFREAPLVAAPGMLLAEDGGALLGFRASDGVLVWTDTRVNPGALAANETVVCMRSLDNVYLLKMADGSKVWKLSGFGSNSVVSLALMPD